MTSDRIISALVSEEHLSLYRNHAEFHNVINVMARILPRIVDEIAKDAEEQDKMRRRIEEILNFPDPRV